MGSVTVYVDKNAMMIALNRQLTITQGGIDASNYNRKRPIVFKGR